MLPEAEKRGARPRANSKLTVGLQQMKERSTTAKTLVVTIATTTLLFGKRQGSASTQIEARYAKDLSKD